MEPISLGGVLQFSFFPQLDPEDDQYLDNTYMMAWIIFGYFILVHTLAFQVIVSFSSSLSIGPPKAFSLFFSPLGFFGLPFLFGAIPIFRLIFQMEGLTPVMDAISGKRIAWQFERGESGFIQALMLDLFLGAILGIILGFGLFTVAFLLGIPFTIFFFLVMSGLGFSILSGLFVAIYAGWSIAASVLFSLIHRLRPSKTPVEEVQFFPISQRAKEIALSDDFPILCQSCGSFNASSRSTCSVCAEPLDQS